MDYHYILEKIANKNRSGWFEFEKRPAGLIEYHLTECNSLLQEFLMGIPGPTELIVILVIVLLIFGAKRIPEIMGGVGQGIKSLKRNLEQDEEPAKPVQAQSTPVAPEAGKPAKQS